MAMAKDTMIWVVDDDPELRKMVGTYLIDNAFSHGTAQVSFDCKGGERRLPLKCGTRARECPPTPGNELCNPFHAWIQRGGVKAITAWGWPS